MSKLDVLVADDAPFIRDVLKHILVKAGHRVVAEAEDGEQAVALAEKHKPHLIIMAIVMPRMSGIEAANEIVGRNPKLKVIACSTLDPETMLMKAMDSGCVDFINKPFHAADVIKIIDKIFSEPGGKK